MYNDPYKNEKELSDIQSEIKILEAHHRRRQRRLVIAAILAIAGLLFAIFAPDKYFSW